ncbi:sortase [Patescibacteria group bacterium]|nr:sortase [Patescibacteria group bacterium]MBU1683645.1 sortase [Patescibacteria group bacterium]
MNISYPGNERGVTIQKITLGDKFWQFVRFTVVTGMIFAVTFFAINFTAYKQILTSAFNPEAQAQAEQFLTTASENNSNAEDLLPVLPDKKETRTSYAWVDFPIAPTDDRLIVPKLGQSVPMVDMTTEHIEGENWSDLEEQIQEGLRNGVVHYPGTAKPGQYGNVFITGHSSYYPWDPGQFKDVFALLGQLEPGDEFIVYYNQVQYIYLVTDKFEVQPDNVSVLEQPTDEKIATLMTCTPVGTALRRLIIRAEQIN